MKVIIFAGGSGTRFWLASRKNNPKQFQEVIKKTPPVKVKYNYLKLGLKPEDIFLSIGIKFKGEVEKVVEKYKVKFL